MKLVCFTTAVASTIDQEDTLAQQLEGHNIADPPGEKNISQSLHVLLSRAADSKKRRDYPGAIEIYNTALKHAREVNDPFWIANIHSLLGVTYLELKNYTMAIMEFESSLQWKNQVDNAPLFGTVSFNLGAIYSDFQNIELALSHYQESLEQFKAARKDSVIGAVLDSIGGLVLAQGKQKEALEYYLEALVYKRKVANHSKTAILLEKTGGILLELQENERALEYFEEASKLRKEARLHLEGELLNKIGKAYFNVGSYVNAEKTFERSKVLAEKSGDKNSLAEIYKNLSSVNERLNRKSREVSYFRKYIALKDSLLAVENQKRINELKTEFEVQNKQKEIEILKHQKALLSSQAEMREMTARTDRTLLIFFTCIIILFILLLVLLIRRHIAKKNSNLVLQNHLAEVRQQKNQIEVQRDIIEQNNSKLEQARKIIVQKNNLLEENNAFLERTINEKTLELYKTYQKLSFHVSNTSLAVMEFNSHLELIRWSDQAERIFGWKAEEVLGRRFHEIGFVMEKDTDGVLKHMHDLLYGEQPRLFFKMVNCNRYKEKIFIEWNTSVLLNKDGSVDSIMAIANDVTSRERAFLDLQSSHRELDNFIYKASHDLRGPLARIQGVVNLGLMEAKEKISRDYFNLLHITANQLNSILSRLLMIYDINHHQIKIEPTLLEEKIKAIISDLQEENSHVNIRVKLNIPKNLTWETDLVLFEIIVTNMFDNALFFRNKKEIVIEVEAGEIFDDKLCIKIKDNGLGIPDNVRERVFDMFFHGTAKAGGTGLGLYMSKKAVERLGGSIQLVNGSPKNTVFTLIFPRQLHSDLLSPSLLERNLTPNQ